MNSNSAKQYSPSPRVPPRSVSRPEAPAKWQVWGSRTMQSPEARALSAVSYAALGRLDLERREEMLEDARESLQVALSARTKVAPLELHDTLRVGLDLVNRLLEDLP